MSRLQEKYKKEIIPALKKEFGFKSELEVPRVLKVVLNTGTGRIAKETAMIDGIEKDMTRIAGQKAVKTKAKKAIASFKTRQGMDIGVKVTLHGKRMYDFIDRLVTVSLPRTRDFRGLDVKNIDSAGNLSIGIKEHLIFPEINKDSAKGMFGLQVIFVTTAKNKESAERLFRLMGFPLKS